MRDFPNRPIRIITVEAGGGGDLVTRLIAQGISGPLGQPVSVDNRTETIAIELVAKAPSDGYTLLAFGSPFWTRPLIQSTPYDPVQDFSPITLATTSPLVVVVHPAVAASVPGYEAVQSIVMFAPAKTPVTVIQRLNQEIVRVLNSAEVKEKFLISGAESASSSPEQFSAKINAELIKWGKVIKDAGIRVE